MSINEVMKLEVVVIPVSDIDRAKEFYKTIGWRLNIDRSAGEEFRLSSSRRPAPVARSISARASPPPLPVRPKHS
jgi:catechol 2,3-dioxygenase-like lactoylglutathione lyase family enzyme